MEKYTCKICSKSFSSGKAIGGHMNTHFAFLPVPPKPQKSTDQLREVNPSMPLSLQKMISRKRSRPCKSIDDQLVDTPVNLKGTTGLVSITSTLEDVALSLMMLSKGKQKIGEDKMLSEKENKDHRNQNYDPDDDYPTKMKTRSQTRNKAQIETKLQTHEVREVYECDTCNKGYLSYQRLQNHILKHKEVESKVYECQYCSKVFKSGRALGGHKKIHNSSSSNSTKLECYALSSSNSAKLECHASTSSNFAELECNFIDLNLPLPEEDDETS